MDPIRASNTAAVDDSERPIRGDGDTPLLDRQLRSLRVSRHPERFQRETVEALLAEFGFSAVAWVPGSTREPTILAGGIEGLSTESYRALGLGARPSWLSRIHVAAAELDAGVVAGWIVAVDRRPSAAVDDPSAALTTVATLIATQRSNARTFADLKDLLFGVVRALTAAIDAKDPYTSGHSERVARIAVRLGEVMQLSPTRRGDLYLMGLLHDVGKIGIDDGVLKKPGPLTAEEMRQIQSHVEIGVHILADLKALHHLIPGIRHHHESLDGSGYPSGLSGEAIPIEARILAVADAFDAMSSNRPYRRRLSSAEIDANFRRGAGKQWDQRIVDVLFSCREDLDQIRQKGLGESLNQAVVGTLGRV